MTPYGKTAQTAIAAISRLAQVYDPTKSVRLSSAQVAECRGLPQPLVGKVLTILSQAGLIVGSPGPRGGYCLAKPPEQITLYDVVSQFDRLEESLGCPFGPGWCGSGPRCPLHHQLETLRNQVADFLKQNTLAKFAPGADSLDGGQLSLPGMTAGCPAC